MDIEIHHIERAHLLGFSDGGNIAMMFAIRHPDRVNRLILNGIMRIMSLLFCRLALHLATWSNIPDLNDAYVNIYH